MSNGNYRITIRFAAEDKRFEAQVPELPGIAGEGATRAEAIANVEQEIAAFLAALAERSEASPTLPPPPIDERTFPDPLGLTMSAGLRRELEYAARSEGVEPERLACELVAAGLALRQGPTAKRATPVDARERGDVGNRAPVRGDERGGRVGQGVGARYHNIMDDRASFLEYVRGLDTSGRPTGGGRRPGGTGPRRDRDRGRGPQGGGGGGVGGGGGTGGAGGGGSTGT